MGRIRQIAHTINQPLERMGYNLRERANIYAGAVMGTAAPVVGVRYILFGDSPINGTVLGESIAWGCSLLINAVPIGGLPIAGYGFSLGSILGHMSAQSLMRERSEKERIDRSVLEDMEIMEETRARKMGRNFIEDFTN